MKENQDIQQQILEALDDSNIGKESLDTLLNLEEGKEAVSEILDLDEAINRKMGEKPDIDVAWNQFVKKQRNKQKESNTLIEKERIEKTPMIVKLLRYAAVCIVFILLSVAGFIWYDSQSIEHPIASNQEIKESPSTTKETTLLEKIKNIATAKVDMITIVASEQKNITLPDGTEVCLNAKSILKYPKKFSNNTREIEFCGEGYFKVHHDVAHPFVIKTNSISTKVLGTEFNIRCYNSDDVHVTLVEGSVEVSLNKDRVRITPNQDAYVESGCVKVQNVNPKDFTSWREGILYFDNASLRTILQQLGRVYNVNVVCKDEHLLNKHFHYMCNVRDSLDEALKLLNATSDLNVKIYNNVIVIE